MREYEVDIVDILNEAMNEDSINNNNKNKNKTNNNNNNIMSSL